MPTATPLPLKIAIANYGHTAPLKDGSVAISGVVTDFVKVDPIIAAFRRMVREVEFDVCELASTTYFIARAFGAPFKALPIFLMRRFHHGGIVCREPNLPAIEALINYALQQELMPRLVADAREALAALPQRDQEWIFFRTAQKLYPALAD